MSKIIFLGTCSGTEPMVGMHHSSWILDTGDHIYWFDDNKWSEEAPYPVAREWQQGSDNFAYCLRMGTKPVVGFENGRNARYVLDKMYESAKNGEGWIEI